MIPLSGLMVTAIGILAAVYVTLRAPAQERLQLAEQSYGAAKLKQEQLRSARILQERTKLAQRDVANLWQGLPTREEFSTLAVAISELGRSEHVAIPGMAYRVEKSEGALPVKATVSFKVSGDYGAIYRFIHRLETAESYLVVESLDAARADKSARARSKTVVFNVTVATFLRPATLTKDMS
jgi:Tfp pilus assembly protein PilO